MGRDDQLRAPEPLRFLAVPTSLMARLTPRRLIASHGLSGALTQSLTTTLTGTGRDGRADKCAALEKP